MATTATTTAIGSETATASMVATTPALAASAAVLTSERAWSVVTWSPGDHRHRRSQ
jgi:hypothetical protein